MRILLLLVVATFLLVNAKKVNEKLAQQYQKYSECLRIREETTKYDEAVHVQAIETLRGSDVILSCFGCVAPEDAMEIESTYKPSSGSIGRVFKKVVDFFRQRLMGQTAVPKYKWTYDWEFAKPDTGWETVTNVHEKKSIGERITDKIRRFLKRDVAKWTLDDRYELKLRSVDRNSSGFYRCINKRVGGPKGRDARIGNVLFLDVKSRIDYEMVESNEQHLPKDVLEKLPNTTYTAMKLRAGPRASPWSSCSQCGDKMGEQFRAIECHLSPTTQHLSHLPAKSGWLKLFGSLPCSSSLVPLQIRNKLKSKKIIQYKDCYTKCHLENTTDRNITSVDELGEKRVLDYIPKGEFLFGEILPPLLPPVIRRGYLITEGDPVVLTCDVDPSDAVGIHWHSKSLLDLNISTILDKYNGRAWVDEHHRIIFDRVELNDQDMFYCYSVERILLGVHHMRVVQNDQTKEIIECFEMVLRFSVFALVAVLIVTKLLG